MPDPLTPSTVAAEADAAVSALETFRKRASLLSGGTSDGALYRRVLGEIERLDARGRVLDFGAGVGSFSMFLSAAQRFDKICAADLFDRPATIGEEVTWTSTDLNAPLPLPPESFDLIVSIETIEHLENPRAVMREWRRLLAPAGTLIFTTPNSDNLRSILTLIMRGHFQQFTDACYPAHISALLTKDVERITREVGFVDLEIGYEIPAHLYRGISFKQVMPFLSRVGKRTGMSLIATCRKPS